MVLRDENIGQMPTQMEILKHIRKVDLSDNKIHKLSEGIADIEGLEELILINNRLTELPKNLRYQILVLHCWWKEMCTARSQKHAPIKSVQCVAACCSVLQRVAVYSAFPKK